MIAATSSWFLNILNDEIVGSNKWHRGEVAKECP